MSVYFYVFQCKFVWCTCDYEKWPVYHESFWKESLNQFFFIVYKLLIEFREQQNWSNTKKNQLFDFFSSFLTIKRSTLFRWTYLEWMSSLLFQFYHHSSFVLGVDTIIILSNPMHFNWTSDNRIVSYTRVIKIVLFPLSIARFFFFAVSFSWNKLTLSTDLTFSLRTISFMDFFLCQRI